MDHEASPTSRSKAALIGYLLAVAAVAIATTVSWLIFPWVEPANLVMTYFLAVVGVATRGARGPAALASVLSVAAFDFFFVPPYLTFAVADGQYLLTFVVMLVVALIISGLTVRVRRQAKAAQLREQRTAALYAMSGELAQTVSAQALAAIAARHIAAVFDADVAVTLAAADGRLPADRSAGTLALEADDLTQARGVLERDRPATVAKGSARIVHLPLLGPRDPLGVVSVRPRRRDAFRVPEPLHLLETFVNQTALALERARLAEEAEHARVRAETERLRSALLTSISHDLRTPLAAITGAATTLLESGARLDPHTQHELLESIRDEAERLNRLVQNLLQMTRLESGALQLRRDWHPLEEVVGAALGRLAKGLAGRKVTVSLPPDLPLVAIDDVLIEQVLINLLDNAIKYTPPASTIRILATATSDKVTVEVADHGPGLPPGDEDRIFEKFYRVVPGSRHGDGLGLAICRGIVEAHGGRIWAQNLPEGGVAFLFTLPQVGARPASVPVDA